MHTGKSLKIALINRDKSQSWLAEQLDVSHQVVSKLCNSPNMNVKTLRKCSLLLDYKPSEFIALSED